MTSNEILKLALGEVGTKESPAKSNRTKYGEAYGLDGYPWCMIFIWWCFHKAEASRLFYDGGKCASCNQYINWAKSAGQWVTSGYKPGDIVFMCFNGSGTASHVGIVYGVTSSGLVTVEGNTSASGSQNNGGMVLQKTRSFKYIVGAARPYYEEEDMTDENFAEYMERYLAKRAVMPVPKWAESELAEAKKAGITDGTEPMQLVPRYQAAIMALRAKGEA